MMKEDSAAGKNDTIYNTTQGKDNRPCSQNKMMKSAKKSRETEVAQSSNSSRRTCPCRSPTRSSAKMYRAKSANGSTSTPSSAPYAYCKIKMRSPTRNSEIQSCLTIENTLPETLPFCQNVCTLASAENAAKLDQYTKSHMETDKVVNELKDEIVQVKHQLHHVLQNQMGSSPPNIIPSIIPCLVKVPSVPVECNNCVNMKERLKQEVDRLNSEKEAVEAEKRMVKKSWNDLLNARKIVCKYDKKVDLLNTEVHKSLKAMELKSQMFCECIKEKDEKIRSLEESHVKMARKLEEQNSIINNKELEREILYVNRMTFKETNDHLKQSLDSLRHSLLDSTAEVLKQKGNNQQLKKDLSDVNNIYMKLISKTKEEKKKYESRIKSVEDELNESTSKIDQLTEKLFKANQEKKDLENKYQELKESTSKIDQLTEKLCKANQEKKDLENKYQELKKSTSKTDQLTEKLCKANQEKQDLENKYQELQSTIQQYESFGSSFKQLESDCKIEYGTMSNALKMYNKEKQDMEKLIEELNGVVKQKNITLERITEINKQQENLIESQSVALLSKEKQLKVMEDETEICKIKSECLAKEMEELKNILKPCNRVACLGIPKELAQIGYPSDAEKAHYLSKEEINSDQWKSDASLRWPEWKKEGSSCEYSDEFSELEVIKENKRLIEKRRELLDAHVDEKKNLIEKRRILVSQEKQLSKEIEEFEEMLCGFEVTCGVDENQKELLKNLQQQINEQKQDWDMQKQLRKEKKVCAAQFPTQKFMDTIAVFERQVKGRKKIQSLLLKMLDEKCKQRQLVKTEISKLTNNIVYNDRASIQELFFNTMDSPISYEQTLDGETSKYSSCSSFKSHQEPPITKTASGDIQKQRNR